MEYNALCRICGEEAVFHWSKPLTEKEQQDLATLSCKHHLSKKQEQAYGTCHFCGQAILIDCLTTTPQEERDAEASWQCDCPQACTQREIQQKIENANARIDQLFGPEAEELGFKEVKDRDTIRQLQEMVAAVAHGKIRGGSLDIGWSTKAKISMSSKGKINVERTETSKYKLEE